MSVLEHLSVTVAERQSNKTGALSNTLCGFTKTFGLATFQLLPGKSRENRHFARRAPPVLELATFVYPSSLGNIS